MSSVKEKHLHIVSPDVPWPADYGGIIDPFCKLKALHEKGIKIHLHCYTQGRMPQEELEKYCYSIDYYQRKNDIRHFSFKIPYIVNSRKDPELIKNLQKDDYPILLEGVHCTYPLFNSDLKNRKVVIRLFNVEYKYYGQLAELEKNPFKKIYYKIESVLLKKYEMHLAGMATVLTLSEADANDYRQLFSATEVHYLPPFVPYTMASGKEGNGCYCLYHGNLAVNENEKAATWLLENVFNAKLPIPFVIAGKNPSEKLQKLAHRHSHTCLVGNPSNKELQDMIQKAQVHVLPSFNRTGIKLKLLNALFNGRHCVVNKAAVEGSGLENYCELAEDANNLQEVVKKLYEQPFAEQEIQNRQGLLYTTYNNHENADKLIAYLW